MVSIFRICVALLLLATLSTPSPAFLPDSQIALRQQEMASMPIGERIARWAEAFLGTPYDTDPLGAYVSSNAIVADMSVDCMYLTFRAVELAGTTAPADAVQAALDKRFLTRGELAPDGRVLNYDERFQYAMDMISSGKWGTVVTERLLPEAGTEEVPGDRGYGPVRIIPPNAIGSALSGMQSGDIVYFVKDPARRVVGEIVGHIGILVREADEVYLIHASGRKSREGKPSGSVVKLPLAEYSRTMPFAGIIVTRF